MEEWKEYNLGDLVELKNGVAFKSSEFIESGIPVIKIKNVKPNKILLDDLSYVSEHSSQNKKCFDILPSDILITMTGNRKDGGPDSWVGKVALFGKSGRYLLNQRVSAIRVKRKDLVEYQYLAYLLSCWDAQLYFVNHSNSSGGQANISPDVVYGYNVTLPSLSEQTRIAAILSSLDDKIEVNRRINDNLEQQAQALFKSWFVDFEPFRDQPFVESELGMIPEGWRVEKIGSLPISVTDYVANGSFASLKENVKLYQTPEYAYFIRNTDLKSGKFEVYVDRHSYEFLSKSTLYGGEIIISNVGDVGSVHLCPYLDKPMTLGNNIIMLKPNKQYYSYYLYILFKWAYGNDLIMSIKGGSAQPKFNKTDFKSLKIIAPKDIVLEKYHSMISVLFNKMRILEDESRRLAELRDTLLPRLMSGELSMDGLKGQFAVSPGQHPGSKEHVSNKTAP